MPLACASAGIEEQATQFSCQGVAGHWPIQVGDTVEKSTLEMLPVRIGRVLASCRDAEVQCQAHLNDPAWVVATVLLAAKHGPSRSRLGITVTLPLSTQGCLHMVPLK